MDTRLGESGINKIKQRFNLFGVCVPSIGKSGGLALLWTKESIVDLQSFSKHHIDAKVTNVGSNEVWRITGFYGEADANKRKHTWALLKRLAQMSDTPWVVIGDYNEVTTQSDKQGGTVIPNWRLQDIREAMIFCGLQEIDYEGFQFTWSNHQEDNQHTQSRLDRASATSDWLLLFPTAIVSHLFTYNSDHMPILLKLKVVQNRRYKQNRKRFRFEAMWLKAEDCDKIVKENWDMNSCLTTNLEGCRLGLMNWEKHTFGSVKKQIREMKLEFEKIQKAQQTAEVVQRRRVLKAKLELVMDTEESMWLQRAKTQWMFEGDRNTKFFHSHASRRAKINGIDSLTGEDGNVCTDERIMGQMVNSYFSIIFKSRRPTEAEIDDVVGIMGPRVSQQINQELNRVFTPDEVRRALFDMYPLKSPGPDGMPALFYQHFWNLVDKNVIDCVLDFLNHKNIDPKLNYTHIVLIPKCKTPEKVNQFCSISLSNVLFKIASKAITNRLKPHMHTIVSETQSAFVPNRLITDNVLVAYEVNHFLKQKTKGKETFMALKLDMSKAYNRVEWVFLKKVLEKLGFDSNFVELIMLSVRTVSYSVLLNGVQLDPIQPERGIRQGDPLSPYLFLFVTEAFSALIRNAEEREVLRGIAVSPRAPRISHLLFADDTLLFCQASKEAALEIGNILHRYSLASGQEINIDKSTMVFSRNVWPERLDEVRSVLPVRVVDKHDKYLGLPTEMGKSKKEVFGWLRERVWKKIDGSENKLLSKAGKEVLIKAVIQAIPTYVMSCFKIPEYLINEIESMIAKYWWGNGKNKRIHWVKWNYLCDSKRDGGMGFRDLRSFNLALLGKQIWRVIRYPNSLLSHVLKAKYFLNCDVLEAIPKGNSFFTWKSICSAMNLVKSGIRWRVGNGKSIDPWKDAWIPRDYGFKPFTPNNLLLENYTVNNFFTADRSAWDLDMLRQTFWEIDYKDIMQIPISRFEKEDCRVWHFSRYGFYSVKSAYHLSRNLNCQVRRDEHGSTSGLSKTDLNWIWRLRLPNKIKIFLWRIIKQSLPVAVALSKREIDIDLMCPVCQLAEETCLDIFKDCSYARLYWAMSNLSYNIITINAENICHWFQQVRMKLGEEEFEFFITSCWSMWSNRNKIVHESAGHDAQESVQFVQHFILRYREAQDLYSNARPPECEQPWIPPAYGIIKINYDAAFNTRTKQAVVGIVARNNDGMVVAWKRCGFQHVANPETAEALAARTAIMLAYDWNFQRIEFEGDCLTVVQQLQALESSLSIIGNIIDEAKSLSFFFLSVDFLFVKRCRNKFAHLIASTVHSDCFNGSVIPVVNPDVS